MAACAANRAGYLDTARSKGHQGVNIKGVMDRVGNDAYGDGGGGVVCVCVCLFVYVSVLLFVCQPICLSSFSRMYIYGCKCI